MRLAVAHEHTVAEYGNPAGWKSLRARKKFLPTYRLEDEKRNNLFPFLMHGVVADGCWLFYVLCRESDRSTSVARNEPSAVGNDEGI